LLPVEVAWRAMFWVGMLPALLAFWIRRNVKEPEIFARQRLAARHEGQTHLLSIFRPGLLPITALASLAALGAQGGYYAVYTFLPLYLNARGLSVISTGAYLSVVIAGSFAGYMTAAHLTDLLGRKAALMVFAAGSFAAIVVYMALPLGNAATLVLGFPLGFFPSGSFSPMGSFFTELFPTSLRGSGQGFCYNFGRGVGAIFPALVGYVSARMALGPAIAVFAGSAYALMVASVALLPETRARQLDELDRKAGR